MDQFETSGPSAEALGFPDVLQDCLLCGVVAASADRRIIGFNQEAARITGLDPKKVFGELCNVLPPPLEELINLTLSSQSNQAGPMNWAHSAGASFTLRANSVLLAGTQGHPNGVVVVLNDLASAHKLSFNIQRLDRLASIGTLSASMAHEIKNALVAITTFVEDLQQRNKDSELASLVGRELRRIDSIVSQMLKFAGPAKPTFSKLSLHRVLDQSLRLVQPQLEAKQIRLRRSFGAQPDWLEGDEYQLEQAFINLLLNATAAMEASGQLSIETELQTPAPVSSGRESLEPSWLQVTIADSGVGIPPEDLSRLFEPFFTTKAHGTGLGLPITRRIVLEHHGRIKVESELNKGTTFRLHFPLAGVLTPSP